MTYRRHVANQATSHNTILGVGAVPVGQEVTYQRVQILVSFDNLLLAPFHTRG